MPRGRQQDSPTSPEVSKTSQMIPRASTTAPNLRATGIHHVNTYLHADTHLHISVYTCTPCMYIYIYKYIVGVIVHKHTHIFGATCIHVICSYVELAAGPGRSGPRRVAATRSAPTWRLRAIPCWGTMLGSAGCRHSPLGALPEGLKDLERVLWSMHLVRFTITSGIGINPLFHLVLKLPYRSGT